ncbi:MAG: GAF domain-containing sensor histidine kinase [Chloroflexi bacterium]|nr:GAF domain-containing sensor histidine kinase [Chloroflexota bacterium]
MADANPQAEILLRRNRELGILNQIAQALNREVDLDRALDAALAQVAELLHLRTGWIWLLREGTDETYLAAAQNLPPGLADRPHRMEGPCYCLDTFRAGDLDGAANVNVVTCSRLSKLVDGTGGLRYHASIPLYSHSEKLGVLNVASADWRELSPGDLQLLYTIGDMLSIAIERARLYESSVELGAVEERNRLSRDIHDTLAQGLTAISLQLETAEAMLDEQGDREKIREAVHRALDLARQNLDEARRSVQDLRAASLEGRTLSEALADLVEETQAAAGVEIEYTATGGSRPLAPRLESGLYRIAQEAVNNLVRHSNASHASVVLTSTPEWVSLTIEDDGSGFEVDSRAEGHYGLQGMQERARLLGGTMELQSELGSGSRLEVRVPLG